MAETGEPSGTEAWLAAPEDDREARDAAVRRLAESSATARYVFPPGSVNERTAAAIKGGR